MRQQPSKKAIMISAFLTALILISIGGATLASQRGSLALTNPTQSEQVNSVEGMAPAAELDGVTIQDAASSSDMDPALEAALDASLDPNMDPALRESLKSALRSALSPQNLAVGTEGQAQEPAFVVTVEPIFLPGQQQAALSGAQASPQRSGQAPAPAPAVVSAPAPAADQVAAAYQAQLEEAYAALQDAYTQIETLQSAPATTVSYGGGYEEDHDDHDEHDGDHDNDHDDHEDHDDDDDEYESDDDDD